MSRVKGSVKTGGRKKGSLNKITLLKEERRIMFDEVVSEIWKETILKMRPEYIGDQFMGKAPDKTDVNLEITSNEFTQFSNEFKLIANKVADELLKRQIENVDNRGKNKDSKPVQLYSGSGK